MVTFPPFLYKKRGTIIHRASLIPCQKYIQGNNIV
jgi:hypothetical protein